MSGETIILAGSGRSGTTWLANILAANPNMRVLFEPFDSRRVPEAAALPLRPYARPDGRYPDWEPAVRSILEGHVDNEWVNRQGRRPWARGPWSRFLVKAIRANLMLGWLSENFNPKIVFMTRHPCAVVLSRVRLEWEAHLDVLLAQPQLVEDHLSPYLAMIEGAKTAVQQHAVAWAIENRIPLQLLPQTDWIFCTYEALYQNPKAESARVLRQLGLRQSWFTRRAIGRVTQMARPDSAVVRDRDPLTDWQRQMPPDDIRAVLDIVAAFGITLYDDHPLPHPNALADAAPLSV